MVLLRPLFLIAAMACSGVVLSADTQSPAPQVNNPVEQNSPEKPLSKSPKSQTEKKAEDNKSNAVPPSAVDSIANNQAASNSKNGSKQDRSVTANTPTEASAPLNLDLIEQRRMADYAAVVARYTPWQFWMGAIGLGALFWTLSETRKTAKSAQKAADVAERSINFAERPWIQFEIKEDREIMLPTIRENLKAFKADEPQPREIRIMPTVLLKNYGKSPAIIVSHLTYFEGAETQRICETYYPLLPTEIFTGFDGFGLGDHLHVITVTPDNIQQVRNSKSPPLIGWVRYRNQHGILMEVGYSFILASLSMYRWERYGGEKYNYEREINPGGASALSV